MGLIRWLCFSFGCYFFPSILVGLAVSNGGAGRLRLMVWFEFASCHSSFALGGLLCFFLFISFSFSLPSPHIS